MAKIWPTDGASALEEKSYRVIKIESQEQAKKARLRVAAYTRVSSDSEDQLNSFAAQNRYYTELISKKPEWAMVDIYADEGITGTSAEKRDDFQRMMADCRRGLVDQILVKSISVNMHWSYQRRMESGTFLPSSMAYSYKIVNKKIEIDPDAALTVCRIFQWYLDGINKTRIAAMLDEEGVPTNQNKTWRESAVHYIMCTE